MDSRVAHIFAIPSKETSLDSLDELVLRVLMVSQQLPVTQNDSML